jgi:hypothetical protein
MPEHKIRVQDHKFRIGQAVEFFTESRCRSQGKGSLYHCSLAPYGRQYSSVSS